MAELLGLHQTKRALEIVSAHFSTIPKALGEFEPGHIRPLGDAPGYQ